MNITIDEVATIEITPNDDSARLSALNYDEHKPAMLSQARDAIEGGNYGEAAAIYKKLLNFSPTDAEVNYQLGLLENQTVGVDLALKRFKAAIQYGPQIEQYWVTYFDALVIMQHYEDAAKSISVGAQYGLSEAYATQLLKELKAKLSEDQGVPGSVTDRSRSRNTLLTLIPAYKKEFIIPLLMSLKSQSYNQFRVVISDDSPNDEITELLYTSQLTETRRKLDIEIIKGPKKGPMANIIHLIEHIQGHNGLVHFLLDDDCIYPDFYKAHISAHANENVGASISYRWVMNAQGQPIASFDVPEFVSGNQSQVQVLDKALLFESVVPYSNNWLGEFSNVVFSSRELSKFGRSCLFSLPYYGLGDIGFYLEIALSANVVLIKNHLSAFRSHQKQNSTDIMSVTFKSAFLSWVSIAIDAYQLGEITLEQLNFLCRHISERLTQVYSNHADLKVFKDLLQGQLTEANFNTFYEQFEQNLHAFLLKSKDWQAAQAIHQKMRLATLSEASEAGA